ncbi:MAG: CesT family type III secretion system chaperone [Kiritimatiellae bacterium]|nr:CesT family type III secretion system chaperone [Kiritimatiellia bacterium]
MTAPSWVNAVIADFARAAGISDLVLNERGAAAFRFENGVSLRFEYREGELVVAATVPAANDASTARRILAYAHPDARHGAAVRAGYLAKSGCAVFAVRLADQEVTLPVLNTTFDALWRIATEFGGAA